MDDKDLEKYVKQICDDDGNRVSSENNHSEVNEISKLLKTTDLYFQLNKYPTDSAWKKIEQDIAPKLEKKKGKIINNRFFRFAAASVIIALLFSSGYFVFNWSITDNKSVELATSQNIIERFELPDGSFVSLNANSKLYFPSKFENDLREVTIEGEAFFEIKPDKDSPFMINAGKAQIKVLGTSFSVNAYPDNSQVEVVVETGTVELRNKMKDMKLIENLILNSGEKGSLILLNNTLEKTTNQDPNFLSWKTRILVFKSSKLKTVFENLRKAYHVEIKVNDPLIEELLLTAQFNDYSLEFIFDIIENTFNIDIQENSGNYLVNRK